MKKIFEEDLEIFVDVEVFGETVIIDGVELKAVITYSTAEKSARLTETFEGLYGDYVLVYFKTADYTLTRKFLPRQGDWVMFNGRRYDVINSQEQQGMAKLTLSAYRQHALR